MSAAPSKVASTMAPTNNTPPLTSPNMAIPSTKTDTNTVNYPKTWNMLGGEWPWWPH